MTDPESKDAAKDKAVRERLSVLFDMTGRELADWDVKIARVLEEVATDDVENWGR